MPLLSIGTADTKIGVRPTVWVFPFHTHLRLRGRVDIALYVHRTKSTFGIGMADTKKQCPPYGWVFPFHTHRQNPRH